MGGHDPRIGADRHRDPVGLLRDLIRFDTTNPPGGERAPVEWIAGLLDAYGVGYRTYAADPDRPALVARLPGGDAPPLLLYGHVDVVPAEGEWTHPPFDAVLEDGWVWGRGALDMKSGVAMFLAAFLRFAAGETEPPGDLLLCVVPDEEAGGEAGMDFLVEEHPGAFAGVEYALGEFGGFPMDVRGRRFYPIQVNEKAICRLEATFAGDGGHGAFPREDGAIARLARFVDALDGARLPARADPTVGAMVERMAAELRPPASLLLRALRHPRLADPAIGAMGEAGALFEALTRDVANPTVVRAGASENVVPGTASVTLDCRLLPGRGPGDAIAGIEAAAGGAADAAEFEVLRFDDVPARADMGLFDTLGGVLEDAGDGVAVPLLLPAGTDGRHLARLGVQSYGFTPMDLPAGFPFMDVIHAPDERIPAECVEWGTERVCEAVRRYGA